MSRFSRDGRMGPGLVTVAFFGGLLLGAVAWSAQMRRSRRDLFSRHRLRRLAALGYLRGQPALETVALLREFVEWEQEPSLRRRGERILRRMRRDLERSPGGREGRTTWR